jgi:hypothetical protein
MVGSSGQNFKDNIFNFQKDSRGSYKETILCKMKNGDKVLLCFDGIPVENNNSELVGYEGIAYKI